MKKRVLVILLTLCLGITLLPALAFKVSDKASIVPNNARGAIYFGKTEGGAAALYRVVAKDADTITLFYDGDDIANSGMKYNSDPDHKNWSGSDICRWLNGEFFLNKSSVFTAAERETIAAYGTTETTNGHVDIDISQKIVLPSVEEVKEVGTWNMDRSTRQTYSYWWLRSPGAALGDAVCVTLPGEIFFDGSSVSFDYGVRPVFKLNLSSVIFTSAAEGGKSGTADAKLSAVSSPSGEQKLTIIDSTLALATIAVTARTGNTLTLSYTGATVGKTLSAIVVNSTGAVTHYGKLAEDIGTDGSVDVTLPDSFDPDTMSLKLFVEQINGNNLTDYASMPVTVILPGTTPASIEAEEAVDVEVLDIEEAPSRSRPLTVWQVGCNDDGHLEFIFVYPYKDNNWLTIYDMNGNEIHREDISYSNPRTVVSLPDGMYTVKTFHSEGHIIQEFTVGLPCGVAVQGVAELPRTGFEYIPYGASVLLAGFGTMIFVLRKKLFK